MFCPQGDVAVIGLACRFPGDANSPSKFWDLLANGRSAYTPASNRYNEDAFHHPDGENARQNVLPVRGGYLLRQDPYVFDAAFFNITATEAVAFDPKQRLAMEVVYEALENSGLGLKRVRGTQTACFIGTSMSDYRDSIVRDFGNYPKYHLLGTSDEMISNRVSHFFDLRGPSATIETACSSSHVATHLACQSIRSGESEMAIVGGVGVLLVPESTMQLNNLGFLSPLGQSRAFDSKAAGYARGEGCGMIILKSLEKAIADGNTIRAIIRGSGVNQDGWTQGVTMPSGDAQVALIKHVYESNGLDYGATQYVEAHGTGTQAGDVTEAKALYDTIGRLGKEQNRSRGKLWIGSNKPNIGHLESAAGVANIIKGVLAMEHGMIPPVIHFDEMNPKLKLDEWNMAVPTKLTPWPTCRVKRMSTSAFGMGGTNAHIVLEGYNEPTNMIRERSACVSKPVKQLFTLSSHDHAGFKRISAAMVGYLDLVGPKLSVDPDFLPCFAYTLGAARSDLEWRTSFTAESVPDLREKLSAVGDNAMRGSSGRNARLGFIFTGQGAQWARMGVELLSRQTFGASVAKSAKYLRSLGCSWDPAEILSRPKAESGLSQPDISQPICTVLQIALIDELRAWGIRPNKVVGHSSGEIAAAYCIGALSHQDAIAVAFYRGLATATIDPRKGGMMAVGISSEDATAILADMQLAAVVACVNSPSNCTLSGDVAALDALQSIFDQRGIFARRLKVEVAYHSPHMQACSFKYAATIADVEPLCSLRDQEDMIMISSVTGVPIDPSALGAYYWVQNLISPVLFTNAVHQMVEPANGNVEVDILFEIGPHCALAGPIEQILAHHNIEHVSYISMLTRNHDALDCILGAAGEMFRRGVAIDIALVNDAPSSRLLKDLPPYPWNHSQIFRADSRIQRELMAQKFPSRRILGAPMPAMDKIARVWRGYIRLHEEPWLRQHTVGSTILFPAAGAMSVVFEAAQQLTDLTENAKSLTLRDVSFTSTMMLTEDAATEIIVQIKPHLTSTTNSLVHTWWEFTVSSCLGQTDMLQQNSQGLLRINYSDPSDATMMEERRLADVARITEYQSIRQRNPGLCSKDLFYDTLSRSGLRYGETFRGVENCRPGNGESTFEIRITEIDQTAPDSPLLKPFLIHGATLDATLQAWMSSTKGSNGLGSFGFAKPMLPKTIDELEIRLDIPQQVGHKLPGFCRSRRHGFSEWSADLSLLDAERSVSLLSISGFRLTELDLAGSGAEQDNGEMLQVDAAKVTFSVKWNYALDLMDPQDIERFVLNAATTMESNGLVELLSLAIHQRPGASILELAVEAKDVPAAIVSRLSRDAVLANRIRHVIAREDGGNVARDVVGNVTFLDALDLSSTPENEKADVLVVSHHTAAILAHELDEYISRLLPMHRSDAIILMSTCKGGPVPAICETQGISVRSQINIGNEILWIFSSSPLIDKSTKPGLRTITILEPFLESADTKALSTTLRRVLEGEGCAVSTVTGAPGGEVPDDNVYISLLELQDPILHDMTGKDFENVREFMLRANRILWITRDDNPTLRLIDGLSRTIANESSTANIQLLQLASTTSVDQGAATVAKLLFSKSADKEFKEQMGILQVSRIYQNESENDQIHRHLNDQVRIEKLPTNRPLRLAVEKPGLLNTLFFTSQDLAPLADHEVEFQVKASGINFRDIMGAMGMLAVRGLGQEASGVVLRTGRLAALYVQPGDRISTLCVSETHATIVRCDYRVAQIIPSEMSFEEAAGIPVTHCTALYAFNRVARLHKDQSVLIHAAAGGTGQAAVQVAKHLGLTVYATVGTADKRHLLAEQYGLREDHIFHSRDTSFVSGIMRATGGKGVDCVLNSLSGELLRVSLECLASFGTFVEIGLRDISANTRLEMREFRKGITFTSVNMVSVLQERPEVMGEIMSEVFELVKSGVLRAATPLIVFPAGQVEDAFRLMQQGKARGKMILSFNEDNIRAPIMCRAQDSLQLDPSATYLIVGGLGGLGRSLATAFVNSGARHLAFVSRSGDAKPEAKILVRDLETQGAQVRVYRCDVANAIKFAETMTLCSQELPPIKGVVQMAMVLRDALFERMTWEQWVTGLRPKVQGSWNVHSYFTQPTLDFMIFCSSISGITGNAGQAQYAAGNTFQDALAAHRRAQGLAAVSVNLGIMRDVGVIAEGVANAFTPYEEALGIREPVFHAAMKSIINGQRSHGRFEDDAGCPSQVALGLGTGDILAAFQLQPPAYFDDTRFGPLAIMSDTAHARSGNSREADVTPLATKLERVKLNGDLSAAVPIITDALVEKIADILRMPSSEVDKEKPLYYYGVDSLVALEFRNWLEKNVKANLGLLEILAAVPIKTFAQEIAKKSRLVNESA